MGIKLAVVTPTSSVLNVECDEVVVPGLSGELGFLPQHVPLISALRPGVLTTISEGKMTFHAVSSGFVEIEEDQVSVLTDTCEEATTIDVDRAKRAKDSAEDRLKELGPAAPGYGEMRRKLRRALARLDAVGRIR